MNKYPFFYITFIITLLTCNNIYASRFLLEGVTTNIKEGTKIELFYTILKGKKWIQISDSTKIINGKFSFSGDIKETTSARLDFSNRFISIYIEPTQMQLYLDGNSLYTYKLTGTKVENEIITLRKQLKPYMEFYFELLDSLINTSEKNNLLKGNSSTKDSLNQILYNIIKTNVANSNKIDRIYFDFSIKHPSAQIVPDLLYNITENTSISIDSIRTIYNILPNKSKKSMMGKRALKCITEHEYKNKVLKNTSVGGYPPNFTRKDYWGNTIKLSNYKNKSFVLLDFWASWCVPCLKEIPKMKDIYQKYRDKNLTIIGISLDNDKTNWSKAILKNELNDWSQILSSESDDKKDFSEKKLSDLYNCDAIPFYILIDINGKVVARWEHIGNMQLKELDEILK